MSNLLLLLFACLFCKSNGTFVELTFNFTVNDRCTESSDADILSFWGRYAYVANPTSRSQTTLFPQCFAFKKSDQVYKQTVLFEVDDDTRTFHFLRFLWKIHSDSCLVSIAHGVVRNSSTTVQLKFCPYDLKIISEAIQNDSSTYCYEYSVSKCSSPSNQITTSSVSERTSSSTVNSPVSISRLSELSFVSIQPSARLSMPTSILSSASQLDSTSSMPASGSTLSFASQLDFFSIQAPSATSSMSTSILSSASQLDSTSSMHILSSRPHSSNSGHTPLSITTMPAVTSIVATTSSYHFNSPSPSLSPPLMNCPGTNQWENTKPGQYANGTCYKGTFNATRYCDLNGRWGQLNCSVSKQFIEIMSKINISHYDALESLSQQLNDFPAAQSIVLLDFIITNSTIESDNETIQWILLDIASKIIQMASNKTDGVSIVSQLLMTLDNAALNIQDFPDEEVTAIDYNGNTLTLPNVIFTALPATVASF
uniref:Uncharacterized protein n=1 Tax=Amphimedon queenslandica TaxID=400682 RepID=A0A1X7TWY5_AMPQE